MSRTVPPTPAERPPTGSALPPGEAALVERLRAGDADAFEELVRREGPKMLAVASRYLARTADAEDAVQDALLNAVRAIGGFQGESRLGTWLHRITVNCALMQIRSRTRRGDVPMPPQQIGQQIDQKASRESAWGLSAAELVARDELRRAVWSALAALPDMDRALLTLRDIQGMTLQDVAQTLDLGLTTVKDRLHRARQSLRRLLDPLLIEARP